MDLGANKDAPQIAWLSLDGGDNDLVMAVSTVKSHVNHIYGKLDVKSRTQAIVRATEWGLL